MRRAAMVMLGGCVLVAAGIIVGDHDGVTTGVMTSPSNGRLSGGPGNGGRVLAPDGTAAVPMPAIRPPVPGPVPMPYAQRSGPPPVPMPEVGPDTGELTPLPRPGLTSPQALPNRE